MAARQSASASTCTTGIGGVFLRCNGDSGALAAWYQKHLGMPLEDFGRPDGNKVELWEPMIWGDKNKEA